MISLPMPGQEKIVSGHDREGQRRAEISRPKTVTSGIEISAQHMAPTRSSIRTRRPPCANLTVSVSITSRVPARASRIIMASLNSERLSAGSSKWLSPSRVRKLHAMPTQRSPYRPGRRPAASRAIPQT